MFGNIGQSMDESVKPGWDDEHEDYSCRNGELIEVPHRSANVRDLDETKTVPRNMIRYSVCKRELRTCVSGVEFGRGMEKVFGGPDDIRTVIFPTMVQSIRQGLFYGVKSLVSVVLNEGLEMLGTEEHSLDQLKFCGVFQESGVKKVKFPSTLKVVKNEAFMGCKNLKSVQLPDGLTEIGLRAFRASGLESITTPPSVRTIRQSAFCLCKNLRYAMINEGLEVLGTDEYPGNDGNWYGVFGDSALEYVELPSTLKRIEYDTFNGCKNLRNINLPERLEYIGKRCFQESALESIILPDALKIIEESTFYECESLKSVVFPNALEKIDLQAFYKAGLENVKLPSSLRTVAQGTFAECKCLKTIRFGEGLEVLGTDESLSYEVAVQRHHGVFEKSALEYVELPSTLKRIEYCAFYCCKSLKSVRLPEQLEYIGKWCFQESALESIALPNSLKIIEVATFQNCDNLKNVVFPDTLEKIDLYAFCKTCLENVKLPASLREVAQGAFAKCKDLKSVELSEGLEALGTNKYADDGKLWCGVFERSFVEHIELPSTLKRIEYNTFYSCKNLKNIELPESIEYIGKQCFCETALESIRLPPQLKVVEENTFSECENLRTVKFPECLEKIDRFAFSKTGIISTMFPASLRIIAQGAFMECESLKTVKFGNGLEVLGTNEYTDYGGAMPGVFCGSTLEEVVLPSTLRRIEYYTFSYCKNLKHITLPDNLEYIGEYGFCDSALESISLPPALKVIEKQAFWQCENLRKVKFSEGLEKIGLQAFVLSGLENIEFPASLRTIAQAAFCKCENLKIAKFSEGLEVLGTDECQDNGRMYLGVFENSSLENVQLPSTLKRIEYEAFEYCENLKSISLPTSLKYAGKRCFKGSGLQTIQVPKAGVQIEDCTFEDCPAKTSLVFRDGKVFPKDW